MSKSSVGEYNYSPLKRFFDITFSILLLIIMLPVILLIVALILLTSGKPVIFIHKRVGKNGKVFGMLKFRTMINGASKLQKKYLKLNQSDGPVFKIYDDPRFTRVGKVLSRSGLDELPQFLNVINGDMSIVGPRPLPVYEAAKLTDLQKVRELIRPGTTSPWVINGSHKMSFKNWMHLDREYVKNANFKWDLIIIFRTFLVMARYFKKLILNH